MKVEFREWLVGELVPICGPYLVQDLALDLTKVSRLVAWSRLAWSRLAWSRFNPIDPMRCESLECLRVRHQSIVWEKKGQDFPFGDCKASPNEGANRVDLQPHIDP